MYKTVEIDCARILIIGICLFIVGVVVLLVDLGIHYSSLDKASSTEASKSADVSV